LSGGVSKAPTFFPFSELEVGGHDCHLVLGLVDGGGLSCILAIEDPVAPEPV
jgi:hypothetical protein